MQRGKTLHQLNKLDDAALEVEFEAHYKCDRIYDIDSHQVMLGSRLWQGFTKAEVREKFINAVRSLNFDAGKGKEFPWVGYVVINTFAGCHCHIVDVLRGTAKRYYVRWRSLVCARRPAGSEQFVPKYVVLAKPPDWAKGSKVPT